ncbi:hypothetical protein G6011_03032 [Alternaria panax]|uniref:Uncharacterized protein n=1 Tax=Alternaria panax TaxID=48097 RepID=A0AAD4I0Z8_9PLEO|nr:hypothetical protein G6011_03032 [Alternaria panax]
MFVRNEDKRHEELCGGAFLEKDASRILNDLGFGSRIWGEGSGAEIRLQSNLPGSRPRWGVKTDSGYESNDEDSIRDNLRYWMAALIQAKINAPCKEKNRVPSVTVEPSEQLPSVPTSVPALSPRPQRSELTQREGPSDTYGLAPSRSKRRGNRSAAMVEAKTKAASDRSRSRARSDDSSDSTGTFSFTSYIQTGSEADFPQSTSNGSKRRRIDIPQGRSHTRSPQQSPDVTSTAGVNLPTDASTNITAPDMINNNDNNIAIHEGSLSGADQMKRKLQLDLIRLLNNEPDFNTILHEVIPPTRKLYAMSPHRKPYSDLEVEFRNFNRALDHWESLIKTRTAASSGVTPSPREDPLQELAAQGTFEDRVAMLHDLGPRSHIDFPFEGWTISLALFFEGLLGDTYMPFPFEDLVDRLRAVNRPLYDTDGG